MTAPEPLHKAAARIASGGTPVFPCSPEDKRPLTKNGFQDATTDLQQVEKWWRRWPDALIGMPTGPKTHCTVVDVDRGKHGAEGEAATQWWEANMARYDTAMLVRTRSGGLHVYCRFTRGDRNTQGGIATGVDRRGEGGYVIVPPSPGYEVIRRAPRSGWPEAPANASGKGQIGLPLRGRDMGTLSLTPEGLDGLVEALHYIFIEPHELHINAQRVAFALAFWMGSPLDEIDAFLHAALTTISRAGLIDPATERKHRMRMSRIARWYATKADEDRMDRLARSATRLTDRERMKLIHDHVLKLEDPRAVKSLRAWLEDVS